jgi:hypothetical protein
MVVKINSSSVGGLKNIGPGLKKQLGGSWVNAVRAAEVWLKASFNGRVLAFDRRCRRTRLFLRAGSE